jgi:hypothetical protein
MALVFDENATMGNREREPASGLEATGENHCIHTLSLEHAGALRL